MTKNCRLSLYPSLGQLSLFSKTSQQSKPSKSELQTERMLVEPALHRRLRSRTSANGIIS